MKAMFHKSLCIITSLLIANFSLLAQNFTLAGKVINAQTRSPIIGASLCVKETSKCVVTDRNGNFTFSASPGEWMRVSYLGHNSQEILIDAETDNLIISIFEGYSLPPSVTSISKLLEWRWLDELSPKTALEEIQKIYWNALEKKDYNSAIKSIVYKMGQFLQIKENSTESLLDSLKKDAERIPQPAKSIVYSLIADTYRKYYRNNQNQIRQRTRVSTSEDDIYTWDIGRLFKEALKYHKMSIYEEKILQQTPISDFGELFPYELNKTGENQVLPTLYDLLVFRTIQSYLRELSAALPQQTFILNQSEYFSDTRTFSEFTIPTIDTLSTEYNAISLYQKLIRFRLQQPDNANNRKALIYADIERLQYVHKNGRFSNNDLLYENALKEIIEKNKSNSERFYAMYVLANFYKTQATGWMKQNNSELGNKYRKAYDLCEQIITSGDSLLAIYAGELQEEMKNPFLSMQMGYLQYPGEPVLANVSYRNMSKLYLYFYKLTDEEAIKYSNNFRINDFNHKNALLFRTQIVDLPLQQDFQEYSTEFKIDGLPQGIYLIVASDIPDLPEESIKNHRGKLTAAVLCQVSSLSITTSFRGKEFSGNRIPENAKTIMQAYLTDSKTGEPVKNGKVDYYCGMDYSTAFLVDSYYTDQYGMVYFPMQHDRTGYSKMIATNKDARFVFYSGFTNVPSTVPTTSQAVFFTDRSIYRPGQTIYFKTLCFENQELLANQIVTIEFQDVNGRMITSQELKTGEYGTLQGNFIIPQGILNGNMSLACKIGEQKRTIASTRIRVEEYKRPTFEIEFNPVEGNYRFNDSVKVSGRAVAYSGYSVDNAQVTYRVVRNELSRFRYWWMPNPNTSQQREIFSGKTVTKKDGSFEIFFKAEDGDLQIKDLIYSYMVTADITDTNGETQNSSISVKISNKPLLIETTVPLKITTRDVLDFDLTTTNLNGDFTPADIEYTLLKLKNPGRIFRERLWLTPDTSIISCREFERLFPFDAYGDEYSPEKYPVIRQITNKKYSTANEKKISLTELKTAESGWYRLDIKAHSSENVILEESIFVQLTGTADGKESPITGMREWLTVLKDKANPGENVEFLVAGGNPKSYIYYEIISGNRVVEQKSIVAGITPKRIIIPIKDEYKGGISVLFLMTQNQRVYHQLVNINVPLSEKQLEIAFTTFRSKLLPGEKEKWTLSIKNKKGEKEMAEMVATLYDASLDVLSPHSYAGIDRFYPNRYFNLSTLQFSYWQMPVYLSKSTYIYKDYKSASIFNPLRLPLSLFPMPGASPLDEIVVIGYGTQQKSTFTGSASVASEIPQANLYLALQGRLPGFNILQYEQLPGYSNENIYIRGVGNSAQNNAPLVLIDGVEGNFSSINPDDVENITILKDDDATAIFGTSGANGVILITTKKYKSAKINISEITTRKNFNETAFFYPQLRTDENGEISIDFIIPEALTRWKLLGFAHTKDFKIGNIYANVITQKQVSVSANAPRFFRENDVIEFTAKISNISNDNLSGQALLRLYDATNMQSVDAQIIISPQTQDFYIKAGESAGLKWKLKIPEGIQAVTYKITAQAGAYSDGEEKTVPVLTNSMFVTKTMPFSVRGGKNKNFVFKQLKENNSTTLRNHRLTLEFTSNPAWYAVQAMPYLMEYPYECAEQVFSRFYANSLASTISNSSPRIRQIFDLWKGLTSEERGDLLLSNLEKNQELKQVFIEETPWVMQAKNENEQKKRIGLLFDLNKMSNELQSAFDKFQKMQLPEGGFPWFEGFPASRFITQHIVSGIEHLKALNALNDDFYNRAGTIVSRGLAYLDASLRTDYDILLKMNNIDLSKQHITSTQLHNLYACSFSKHKPQDKKQLEAFNFYLRQAVRYWKNLDIYSQALTALALNRYGEEKTAKEIIRFLKETAQQSEEMGMYWINNKAGYFWHQAPIETQALLIEAFNEVTGDKTAVEEMKIWLLRNKQTDDWGTTKATAEACYALLMTGDNLLDESQMLDVKIGGKSLASVVREEIRPEQGTGYVKTALTGSDIKKEMAELEVKNPNRSGIAWGGVYWQYFEQLDKIASSETNLQMNKRIFVKKNTERGPLLSPVDEKNSLKVGDIVTVRLELRADRDYEYVHLKDMRASSFEPVKTLSGSRYQDGLWYYENIKDASTNFFFNYLRKGVYVFEYELRVTHAGEFSNGITTFQCMYAPEFSSHSEGERVIIRN